ncbi:MAG: TIGR03885 family FMN-dependent LLM class oxidoreductase [Gemmatimonadota bacterium]|nr:TIGR03885 family FMN-dependent LLM class oxidoreductase [Gemmatimonadota bacterium]
MPRIAYHCSHEQFAPSRLLDLVQAAERAGFTGALSSDHFHPWTEEQGESGLAWTWLGAALQATQQLPFGVVCAPGQRYHPAIIAQGAATLAEMFPDRFWIAIGSGQHLNEGITGQGWPSKQERNARLRECAEVMRALWAGETVTHRGHITVEEAKLYTRPERPPLLVAAAITEQTARWAGGWADALITVSRPPEELRPVVEAFREGGGEGKPIFLKVQLSYAATEEEARHGAWEQWRANIFDSPVLADLRTPKHFDALAKQVQPDELEPMVRISADPERHLDWLREDLELGFEQLILHNVNLEQERFIEVFGERVLPELRSA